MRPCVFALVIGMGALVATVHRRRNAARPAAASAQRRRTRRIRRGSCGEQSLRRSLETGRRRNPRCEGPDRSAGPQRRQRWPLRLHHLRPGRLHGRHDCVAEAADVCGPATDAARSARRDGLLQLVLGIVRGERGPQRRDASDIRRAQPVVLRDRSGARIHDFRQPADAAAADLANGDQRTLTWERVPDLPNLTPTHRKLIGFWKLISLERRNAKGELLSSNPGMTGFIVYTASGHVMVHMMHPTAGGTWARRRRRKRRWRRIGATPAISGHTPSTSPRSYVVHHLAGSINSGAVGTDFQRFFELSGKRLTLKPPVTKDGNGEDVHTTITWERLS